MEAVAMQWLLLASEIIVAAVGVIIIKRERRESIELIRMRAIDAYKTIDRLQNKTGDMQIHVQSMYNGLEESMQEFCDFLRSAADKEETNGEKGISIQNKEG